MNVTLVLVQEDGSKKPVPMKKDRLVVGRKPESTIRVPVSSVSREHCEVVLGGGRLMVRDLGSSNGTYVNGARVQEAELKPGDVLAVGPAVFVIVIDGKPADVNAKAAIALGRAPEPVAAASGPATRPASPSGKTATPGTSSARAPAKPQASSLDDELDTSKLDESSVSDFDFDFLDEDEEDKKKL